MTYDVIIRDGLWFDGTGNAPQTRSLGIRDGVVATVSCAAGETVQEGQVLVSFAEAEPD